MASPTNTPAYTAVMKVVRGWSAAERLSLVQDILATLTPEVLPAAHRQPTLTRALGLLATDTPSPSDADIAALLDERRQEQYGL